MQGRLSPIVDNKIQSFPWETWQSEIVKAKELGFSVMEWTLDQYNLRQNPLMNQQGQAEILQLCAELGFSIPSLTGDCFMQAPFWKEVNSEVKTELERNFLEILEACKIVGITKIIVPLVDNGSIQSIEQENALITFFKNNEKYIRNLGLKIIFESDFSPVKLNNLMLKLKSDTFGINYDIGNSAANGYNPINEFLAYGARIVHVHVKDRMRGGTTVPLQTGSADFNTVFSLLAKQDYNGDFILQTARDPNGNHSEALVAYKNMTIQFINENSQVGTT